MLEFFRLIMYVKYVLFIIIIDEDIMIFIKIKK